MTEAYHSILLALLEETFEHCHDIYLDQGTSLFETLESIQADEASHPVSADCASIAAQADHIRFYLDVMGKYMLNQPTGEVDWQNIWQNTGRVTQVEWEHIQQNLKISYEHLLKLIKQPETQANAKGIEGSLGILAHTAYHLGEIRQALCLVKNKSGR